jgi:23S rRNA (uracil1939-C5)-methyltransferase
VISLNIGQKITATVEKLVFGGAGLLRHNTMVVFVPGVLPQETIECTITATKARYAEGSLSKILQSSPHRVAPVCRHYGTCGGCQLQHVCANIQPEIKKNWLENALHKVVSCSCEFVAAESPWAWRRSITLHGRWNGTAWNCGYVACDGVTLLDIQECPIFIQGESPIFSCVHQLLRCIPGERTPEIDISIFRLDDGFALRIVGKRKLDTKTQQALCDFIHSWEGVKSCLLQFPQWEMCIGSSQLSVRVLGGDWFFAVSSFLQANLSLCEHLWTDLFTLINTNGKHQKIVDLYSGVGITAISLAQQGHEVVAVEMSKAAVQAATVSAKEKNVDLRFECSSVESFLSRRKISADWFLVNPPRTGLSRVGLQRLIAMRPKRICYISCSPPTLARDLEILVQKKWKITSVRGYDMFPQTTHLESLVTLEYGGD